MESVVVGVDLAGSAENPTGWAVWRNRTISARHLYSDEEILRYSMEWEPALIAIDAPLSLPVEGAMRRADREMRRRGYPVLPPRFPAMEGLTLRAMRIAQEIARGGCEVIEVHPTSTRRALKMPTKDWSKIQGIFTRMGLGGDLVRRALTPHEIDAVTASLTGHLYIQGKIELVGDERGGWIVVPVRGDWRELQL